MTVEMIAVIGAGNVGRALGGALLRAGEAVRFGVPQPDKYASAVAEFGPGASVLTVEDAIRDATLVILAVPYAAALSVAQARNDWEGRVLVDVTNPIAPGFAGLSVGTTSSGAEQIAAKARNASVVKAFNTTGAENLARPRFEGGAVVMPICGDDAEARRRVIALAARLGFDPLDAGGLAAARYIEPMAMLWIHTAIRQGAGRDWAFARVAR